MSGRNIEDIVRKALEKVSKLSLREYLKAVMDYLGLKYSDCELYKVQEEDCGYELPFLVWVNKEAGKEAGLGEKEILDSFFNGGAPISSGQILEALNILKAEIPFSRERNIAKRILSKTGNLRQRREPAGG
jgi:hypothetical protein